MTVSLGTVALLAVVLVATLSRASCLQLPTPLRSDSGERANASMSKDDDVCDVMGGLWRRAAEIFQIDYRDDDCMLLRKFYGFSPVVMEGWQIGDSGINYMPIWKNANNAIRCNLGLATAASEGRYIIGAPAFTFVRDPVSRFVSAFSEINFKANNCVVGGDFQRYPLDSTERARTFLSDLLGFRLNFDCWVNYHVFSQLGPLSSVPVPLNYVGRLENFEADWLALGDLIGQRMPDFDSTCSLHESTDASSGYPPRDAMNSALGEDLQPQVETPPELSRLPLLFTVPPPALSGPRSPHTDEILWANEANRVGSMRSFASSMRQVFDVGGATVALACSVLLPDYVCLRYALPVTDDACVEAGFATSVDEWRWKVEKVRETFCR
eukprot:TRINITY_DN7829_c0_g1_i3.p1 TRINITY_DN7829_c0_g1~~TRINITY_DN7829_c0_g1_i3.p1  ORF type:complete len:382 (+),score=40.92 TRINITY_DN7829_c0_g1_i3:180-1325(+)